MQPHDLHKVILWMGDSKETISNFPVDVKSVIGYALRLAQAGETHGNAKAMKHNLRDAMEISVDVGDAYRACYTTKLGDSLYVLDAFQKKSKSGINTPRRDLDRIEDRLKEARRHYETERKRKIKNKSK